LDSISLDIKHKKLTQNQSLYLKELFTHINWIKNISLNNCKIDAGDVFQNLMLGLGNIRGIESLKLMLADSKFEEHDFIHFYHSVSNMRTLKKFALNMAYSETLSNFDWLKGSFKNLKNLDSISLTFDGSSIIKEEAAGHLRDAISNKYFLKEIDLSLVNCGITNTYQIVQGLQDSLQLESLTLNFSGNDYDDTGFNELLKLLKIARNLTNLNLNFSDCGGVRNFSVEVLKEGLIQLSKLKRLGLSFQRCTKIKDTGIHYLSKAFSEMSGLKELKLSLLGCTNITDVGTESICKSLANMGLTRLVLQLGKCPITDLTVRDLSKTLKQLNQLRDLHLNFDECKNITEKGIDELFTSLEMLKEKFEFLLSIEKNKELTNQTLVNIAKRIPGLTNMKLLVIQARQCQFSNEALNKLRKAQTNQTAVTLIY